MSKVYQYSMGASLGYLCLKAKKRTTRYIKVIEKTVKEGDIVVEAGAGTGILSITAALAGAKKVYAIEQDDLLFPQLKHNIQKLNLSKIIKVIKADAINISLPEKVDLIICEMISTGLIDEPQIQAVNNLLPYLNSGGSIIPWQITTLVRLTHENYSHYGFNLPYIHYEYSDKDSNIITETAILSKTNLMTKNDTNTETTLNLKVLKEGEINTIRMSSTTRLTGNDILGRCAGYCGDLLMPIKNLSVKKNEILKLTVSYIRGKGILSIKHDVMLK